MEVNKSKLVKQMGVENGVAGEVADLRVELFLDPEDTMASLRAALHAEVDRNVDRIMRGEARQLGTRFEENRRWQQTALFTEDSPEPPSVRLMNAKRAD